MNRDSNRNAVVQKLARLTIERSGWGGVGIARDPAGKIVILHAPLALFPGEVVEARVEWKRQHGEGTVVRWIEKSDQRVDSECPYALRCGGCSLWEAGEQASELKRTMVADLINREFKRSTHVDEDVKDNWQWIPAVSTVKRYRIQLHYEDGVLGYFEKGSNRIVKVNDCVVANKALSESIQIVRRNIRQLISTEKARLTSRSMRSGDAIRARREYPTRIELSTGVPSDVVYVTSDAKRGSIWRIDMTGDSQNSVVKDTQSQPFEKGMAGNGTMRLLKGEELAEAAIIYAFSGATVRNHPTGFFQVCPTWSWEAFGRVFADWKVEGETLYDLYGGCGFFSVLLRKQFKTFSIVESDKNSVEFARTNLAAYEADFVCDDIANWLKTCCEGHATHIKATSETAAGTARLRRFTRGGTFPSARDVLILDPPRAGLTGEVANLVSSLKVKSIILIGCDGASFCRDALRIAEAYRLTKLTAIDLFPMTPQVELVGMFECKA